MLLSWLLEINVEDMDYSQLTKADKMKSMENVNLPVRAEYNSSSIMHLSQ